LLNNPLVSVITTVYSGEKYLCESFFSIVDQEFKDFEWIIVNDGSTDTTSLLIKSFLAKMKISEKFKKNIRIIDNKDNKGIPVRRNEAIKIAKGKYIAIHDADDISLPHRLKKQVDFLEEHKDVFCLGGHAIEIDENGEKRGERTYPPYSSHESIDIITSKETFYLNPIIDPSTMFRRSIFLKLGGYSLDKSIYLVPDYDLWLKSFLNGEKIYNLQDFIIKYRKHNKSRTGEKKKEMIKAHMVVWKKFIKNYKKRVKEKKIE